MADDKIILEQDNILISVIMPTYNSQSFIEESILSVVNQSYYNWELIIVDDGSTDSTKDIVTRYVSKDKRIKYYYQQNAGQAKARNLGLEQSEGLFVAFIDSDDLWLPNMLEDSIIEFGKESQDVLFSNSYLFHDGQDHTDLQALTHFGIHSYKYVGTDGLGKFIKQNRISMDGVFASKESILKTGGFRDEARGKAEDYELWLTMLANGATLRGWDRKLSLVRKHPNSTMATSNIIVEIVIMFCHFFTEHTELSPFTFRNEISDWLGRVLSLSNSKEDIFRVYNSNNLQKLGFRINTIKPIYSLRKLLPLKVIKKILYTYLAYFDKKYNS